MRAIVVILAFLIWHRTVGQRDSSSPRIDSLKQVIETASADSIKVFALADLLYEYMYTDAREARRIAKRSIAVAEQSMDSILILKARNDYADLHYFQGLYDTAIQIYKSNLPGLKRLKFDDAYAQALIGIGNNYWRKGDYINAQKYMEMNLDFSREVGDKEGVASSYNNLGNITMDMGDYAKALDYYTRSSMQFQEIGMEKNYGITLVNIGIINSKLEEYESARDYYTRGRKIFARINFPLGENYVLKSLGILHKKFKNYDSALYYYNTAIGRYEKMQEKFEIAQVTHNVGNVYYETGDLSKAEAAYARALAINEEISDSLGIVLNYKGLGNVYFDRKEYSKSKEYLRKTSAMGRKLLIPLEVIEAEQTLAAIYSNEGDYKRAYESEHAYAVLRDSLFNSEREKLTKEIEARYQTEQSAQEIELLRSENEIKTIQIQNRERERFYLIALAAVILVLVVALYNRYKIKNRAHAKLKELDTIKSRFFANISHEFRTPLTLIAGCLEDLVEKSSGRSEDQLQLSIMQRNTVRLRQLIEQLLDLSKLESGKLSLGVAPVNPRSFLTAITSSFSSWATQKEIVLNVDIPHDRINAFVDEDILEKIIDNLLSNAIKFTPQKGTVSLSASWNTKEMMIQIRDSGPGIPASKVNHIFDRFYQVDDSTTRTQEGSGIGLALVKELVVLHHGRITVNSREGEGAVFSVTIPIQEDFYSTTEIGIASGRQSQQILKRHADVTAEAYDQPEVSQDNPTVLVVEDNIDLAHYIGDHLPSYEIILAGNGMEGFNKAVYRVPDLIISDVMMPEMDGVEFCKRIRREETTSHIPVILLTARADVESRLEGLDTGADDYMTKPFDARELQTRVKNLILQREHLKERFSRTMILKPKDIAITSPDEIFLEKVMGVIEGHMGDSEFTTEDFQQAMGMSRMQLHRKLKALTGHSAGEFMRTQRLIRASELLTKTDSNISDACYQTGFNSLSYFDRCFKKQFGVTPKEYISAHSQIR